MQKDYVARKQAEVAKKDVLDDKTSVKQPTFKANPYYNYAGSLGLKI